MNNPTANPLLDLAAASGLPRFSAIRPEHAEPAVDATLAGNRAAIEHLLAETRVPTWDGLVQPIEDLNEALSRMWSPVAHLNAVMNNEALRAAFNNCLPKLTEYWTAFSQDPRVYRAYQQIRERAEFARFSQAQRIVENALRDFRLAGAGLPRPGRRGREIQSELPRSAAR